MTNSLLTNSESIIAWQRDHASLVTKSNSNSVLLVQYALNRLQELYCAHLHSDKALQMRSEIFRDLQRAANTAPQNSFAMFLCGLALQTGFGCDADVATGKALILVAAKVHHCPDALNYLGLQQYKYNPSVAVELFRLAADQGHKHAARNLGLAYLHGKGVAQSFVVGLQYLQQAGDVAVNVRLMIKEQLRRAKIERAKKKESLAMLGDSVTYAMKLRY